MLLACLLILESGVAARPGYPPPITSFQIWGYEGDLPYIKPMPNPGYYGNPACTDPDPEDECWAEWFNDMINSGHPTLLGVHTEAAPLTVHGVYYPNMLDVILEDVDAGSFAYVIGSIEIEHEGADHECDNQYQFAPFEHTHSAVLNMVTKVKNSLHAYAPIGNYNYMPGTGDISRDEEHYEYSNECRQDLWEASGLNIAMPIAYMFEYFAPQHTECETVTQYEGEECDKVAAIWYLLNDNDDIPSYPTGVGVSPNARAGVFWSMIEHVSCVARGMSEGEVLMPWVSGWLDDPCLEIEEPPLGDFQALIQHYRLRGALAYITFSEPEDAQFRADMLDAWLYYNEYLNDPTVLTLDTHKKIGVEASGMLHDDDKFSVVLSNLRDDQDVYINLPDLPGVPEGVLVGEGEHYPYTYTLTSAPSLPIEWPITRPGDANWNGTVDTADYLFVIANWGACDIDNCDPCYADLNNSGTVNYDDVWIVISNYDS
jgi:hypothetical protein